MKKIIKIGQFNLIEKHVCELPCKCGWYITIGGTKLKDLKNILKYLKNYIN